MNPRAAQEFLDLIMLDDFVERKRAADDWARRWIATMHVEFVHDGTCSESQKPALYKRATSTLLRQIFDMLKDDEVHALNWGCLVNDPNSLAAEMHVILQEPRDINAGESAAQRMKFMAGGGKK